MGLRLSREGKWSSGLNCNAFLLSRQLQKVLLKFYACLMGRLSGDSPPLADVVSGPPQITESGADPMNLTTTLCRCLDVAGCPDYYDLPLLETSLDCLQHLTARLEGRRKGGGFIFCEMLLLSTQLPHEETAQR